ncbi:hypothetical protein AK812_SmicGene28997 [Symbiodinium microadriaticum]|uniref:RNase H type-1 domain-containing protein n=1 Tax=Symbiodinium microadriaticum TaxID=2951 RepID=A0A1Q9D313_SYMMI|nr:hypothetical protein AK812_SmicGene28997 [Symbiodinium microadriaticum]
MMKDREMKTQQWKAYVDGAKAAYLREKERHQAALNNSEKEIAAAKLAQDEARQAVIATIDRQSLPQAAQEEMEVEEEWDTMLEAWDQEQVEQFDGVLRRAMAERQLYQHPIITPQRPSHRAPRAPTVVTTEATHAPPRDGSATSEWCQLCFGFSGWTTSGTRHHLSIQAKESMEAQDQTSKLLPKANELRLSAMIFAPHYHPLCVQIPVLPEDGPQDVIERAAEAASQGLHPDFTTVTPATGMPLENLALFVATPECLIESGRVVTFLDLSAVGGQTFACVLPDQIAFPDLVNFLVPLATTNHDSLEIFLEGSTVAASSDQSLALFCVDSMMESAQPFYRPGPAGPPPPDDDYEHHDNEGAHSDQTAIPRTDRKFCGLQVFDCLPLQDSQGPVSAQSFKPPPYQLPTPELTVPQPEEAAIAAVASARNDSRQFLYGQVLIAHFVADPDADSVDDEDLSDPDGPPGDDQDDPDYDPGHSRDHEEPPTGQATQAHDFLSTGNPAPTQDLDGAEPHNQVPQDGPDEKGEYDCLLVKSNTAPANFCSDSPLSIVALQDTLPCLWEIKSHTHQQAQERVEDILLLTLLWVAATIHCWLFCFYCLAIQQSLDHAGSYSKCPTGIVCKQLREPQPTNMSDLNRLESLRSITRRSMLEWPYLQWNGDPQEPLSEGDDTATDTSAFQAFVATLFIFKIDYQPERVHLYIDETLTEAQLLAQLQEARDDRYGPDFPCVRSVHPQPHQAWGALIAVPDWEEGEQIAVLDLLRIDGRIYATQLLPTIDRAGLLFLADLPATSTAKVFIGAELEPLQDAVPVVIQAFSPASLLPIQLGWICLRLSSGRVDISGLREELAAAVPLNRRLVLTPPPAADGRLYLHPGQVVTVRCIEATAGANGPAHSDDTDSEGADSAAASSDSTSSDAPSDDPDPDHVRHLDTVSSPCDADVNLQAQLHHTRPKLAIGLDSCLPKPKPEAACVTGDIASAPLEYIAALRTLPAQHAATIGTTELGFTWGALVSLLELQPCFETWEQTFGEADHIPHAVPDTRSAAIADICQDTTPGTIRCYTDGSFYPAKDGKCATAGWAVLFVDPHAQKFAISAGPFLYGLLAQDVALSAYQAECCALAIAATTAVLAFSQRDICFLSDCTSAIHAAQGQSGYSAGGLPEAMAAVFDLRCRVCKRQDSFVYVPGHAGEYFNEAVDLLAKWGAHQPAATWGPDEAMTTLTTWLQHGAPLLPWVTLVLQQLQGVPDLPPFGALHLGNDQWHAGLSSRELLQPFLPKGIWEPDGQEANAIEPMRLSVRIASYNTLSLGGSLEGEDGGVDDAAGLQSRPGRAALLAKQLDDLQISIASLQETRSPAGATSVGAYFRYSSGSNKHRLTLDRSNLTVVYSDPRRMWLFATRYDSYTSQLASKCGANYDPSTWHSWFFSLAIKEIATLCRVKRPLCEAVQGTRTILKHIQEEPSALHSAGASAWQESLADRLTDSTWFLLQSDNTPILTTRGTRPGSTAADLLFAMVVKKILHRRDQLLQGTSHGSCTPRIPWDNQFSLEPPSADAPRISLDDLIWADDISCMRICDVPRHLPCAVGCAAGALSDAFAEYGFVLSYGPAKTAALAQAVGPGSRQTKRTLFTKQGLGGQIVVLRENSKLVKIPLVAAYKHLGVKHASRGAMYDELRFRAAQAAASFQEGRRKIYRAGRIPVKRKAFILNSTVLPKLLFGAGSWPPPNQREFGVVSGALWTFYRAILGIGKQDDQHWSAHTVLALTGLPSPQTTLHNARLLYLGQICRAAPPALWALIKLDRPYAQALLSSLTWVHGWTHATSPLPNPVYNWTPWHQFILDSPGKFRGLVLRAQGLETCKSQVIAALDGLYRVLTSYAPAPVLTTSAQSDQNPKEVCIPCKRMFHTRRAWAGHSARVHGYRNVAHLLACSPFCSGCGRTYANVSRLRRHLNHSTQCVERWGSWEPPAKTAADTAAHPQAPPFREEGLLPGQSQPGLTTGVSQLLLKELREANIDDEERLWEIVTSVIEPIQVLRNTVQLWKDQASDDPDIVEAAANILLLLDPELLAARVFTRPGRSE